MSLSPELVEQFHRDGFLKYQRVLVQEQLMALSDRVDEIACGKIPMEGQICYEKDVASTVPQRDRVWQIWDGFRFDAVVKATCFNESILDAVESLIGPEIRLYSDQTLMKPAHHGSAVAWHQDYPYWPFDRPELVTCWLAIDDANLSNGCMRLIPGSHKHGTYPTRDDRRLRDQEEVDTAVQVPVELSAGHCMFHHCLTLHATSENKSVHRRRAIAITYMPADLKWVGEPGLAREFPLVRALG